MTMSDAKHLFNLKDIIAATAKWSVILSTRTVPTALSTALKKLQERLKAQFDIEHVGLQLDYLSREELAQLLATAYSSIPEIVHWMSGGDADAVFTHKAWLPPNASSAAIGLALLARAVADELTLDAQSFEAALVQKGRRPHTPSAAYQSN